MVRPSAVVWPTTTACARPPADRSACSISPGFDALTAQLQLAVAASGVFEHSVVGPAGDVAGPVHSLAARAEGTGDEAAGGQTGPAGVTAGELAPRQIQFAPHTDRQFVERPAEHVQAGVPTGAPIGMTGPSRSVTSISVTSTAASVGPYRLCRRVREPRGHTIAQWCGQSLAGTQNPAQIGQCVTGLGQEGA